MISHIFRFIYVAIGLYTIHPFFLTPWRRKQILNDYYKKSLVNTIDIIPSEKQSYFFGMIGPNIYEEKVQNMFDLFTGNCIINGVFFNKKNISVVNNFINTESQIYQTQQQELPQHHEENVNNQFNANSFERSSIEFTQYPTDLLPFIFVKPKNAKISGSEAVGDRENSGERSSKEFQPLIVKMGKYLLYLLGISKVNNIGMANTAILPIQTPIDKNTTAFYVLFERNMPYLVYLYHNTSTISTICKMKPPLYLSAHSKIKLDSYGNHIFESIDCNIISKKVTYYTINENLTNVLSKYTIFTHYYPLTNDFLSTKDSVIIIDSPMFFNYKNIQLDKMPFYLDKTYPTYIHILHKYTGDITTYRIQTGFCIFHFAKYVETYNRLEIFASIYDNIDFNPLDIKGNYRKIILDKCSKKAYICNNPYVEKYNLDFPIVDINGNVILRNIKNRKINGFIKVNDDLSIIKKWKFNNTSFCGEPAYIRINNRDTLIAMANDDNTKMGKLCIIDMESDKMQEYMLQKNIHLGFHSIFITHKL
jgi:hypothetical protein